MNKKEARKLTLTRETLQSLQSDELGAINGGTNPVVVTASIRFCYQASRAVSAVSPAVGNSIANHTQPWKKGAKKVGQTAKKVFHKLNPFD